ncbi:hypothetical protein EX30DRAFT_115348 [Ascodesmis nigricans]|uniref:Uncharacterized protein n=1 Tax=Ascodesmis nigricans TaxID=341454 RepID=A0A4S2MPZ7_9PEZI|nr:hypothetical protein EX30DRAFT_115348 [Ascodesmis nigricans]
MKVKVKIQQKRLCRKHYASKKRNTKHQTHMEGATKNNNDNIKTQNRKTLEHPKPRIMSLSIMSHLS